MEKGMSHAGKLEVIQLIPILPKAIRKKRGVYADISSFEMRIGKLGKAYGLLILLAGVLAVYVYFLSYLGSDYSPYYGDEYFYYKNSEVFYLTNSLKASFTYSGNGARVFGADAHGPAYPLIYGSIAKVLGWGRLTIPIVNGGILIMALLVLVWNKETTRQTKYFQCLLVIGSPITLFYSITYLPELIQIAGAIGLYLLFQRYLLSISRRDFLILVVYILILGSIRSTWFFAFFGLMVIPGPIKGFGKSIYLFLGLVLPFLYQHFLHEQVPNTFSALGEVVEKKGFWAGMDGVIYNIKRNTYFAFTYTEGYFYTVQKVWIAGSLLFSIFLYRQYKVAQFGIVILVTLIIFNVILYKNYSWVDLRMYTPMTLFLNLVMISSTESRVSTTVLISVNLLSFLLVIPLQLTLIHYRIKPDVRDVPAQTVEEIKTFDSPLVSMDSVLLKNYSVTTLPILTNESEPIRYILQYYSMKMQTPSHVLCEESNQLKVKPVKILSQ
ncbi:hypothetical protein [Algoriphagus sp. A40]|uniref:hypothetical protein n=1 Tax=Algoriphagus sp. A40 TaxID=1945863 RepID=UPI00111580A7|nr:hypothetical protein [Algoriphagus sp. A40]